MGDDPKPKRTIAHMIGGLQELPSVIDVPAIHAPAPQVVVPKGKRGVALPALTAGLMLSSILDAETTFALKKRGGYEANPLMRPLVNAGRLPTYAVLGAANVGLALLANEAKKRKIGGWWLPLALPTLTHTLGGVRNARLR